MHPYDYIFFELSDKVFGFIEINLLVTYDYLSLNYQVKYLFALKLIYYLHSLWKEQSREWSKKSRQNESKESWRKRGQNKARAWLKRMKQETERIKRTNKENKARDRTN